jgi:hypothetical protein
MKFQHTTDWQIGTRCENPTLHSVMCPIVSAATSDRRRPQPSSTAMMARSRRPFSVEISGLHYNDERPDRNSTSRRENFYFWEFLSSGRGFRQFVGCTWQVFLCFQGEDALLALPPAISRIPPSHHSWPDPARNEPLNLAVPSTRISNDKSARGQ